jgi:hypothetical protein
MDVSELWVSCVYSYSLRCVPVGLLLSDRVKPMRCLEYWVVPFSLDIVHMAIALVIRDETDLISV